MIYAEPKVLAPSYKYKLDIHCMRTRRLTAIEWLILTCIKRFKDSVSMSDKTLKEAFEKVLGLQDSTRLIRPSIESLIKLRVVEITGQSF